MIARARQSLGRRTMSAVIIGAGASTVSLLVVMVTLALAVGRREFVQRAELTGRMVSEYCVAPLAFGDLEGAHRMLAKLERMPSATAARLLDERGHVVAQWSRGGVPGRLGDPPALGETRFGDDTLELHLPVAYEGLTYGSLHLGVSTAELQRRHVSYLAAAVAALAGALALSWVVARRLARRISGPVLDLAATMSRVSKDQGVRASVQGTDEVATLCHGFNDMLDQLEARRGEILQLNRELEQRVADRTAALEQANRELESFAYSVSHDLRAPLRHVDGFLTLLAQRLGPTLDPQAQHYLEAAVGGAGRMGKLIDDLLSFARMARQEMARSEVDLTAVAREVLAELEPETVGRTVRTRVDALPVVTGDRAMLRTVFYNLLSNALKFTRPRAEAEIVVSHTRNDAGEHVISIHDNGVGFDMAYAGQLFSVFRRLHKAEEFVGVGAGLANVRRVVARHGGRTWAEGKVGGGATFSFSLPA